MSKLDGPPLLALVTAASLACATSPRVHAPPVLATERPVVLPLGDPFIAELPYVTGFVGGLARPAPFEEAFVADSGAAISVLRSALTARLGLTPREYQRTMTVDPLGHAARLSSVIVPRLQLGPLVVRDLDAAVSGTDNLLGNDLLGQTPWELDLDRATLTLNAPEWPKGSAISRVVLVADEPSSLKTIIQHGPCLSVRVNGRDVKMVLDTGASQSALPAELAKALGLAPSLAAATSYLGTSETMRAATSTMRGDLRVGDIDLGPTPFLILDAGRSDRGLLGMDMLRRFVFRVTPGRWVELRRRGDPDATATERVARWPWSPHCMPEPCVEAHLEGRGDATQIVMTLSATYRDQPTSFVWHCPTEATTTTGRPQAPFIGVFLPAARAGQTVRLAPQLVSPGWSAAVPSSCRTLALVDIGPAGLVVSQRGAMAALLPFLP